MLEGAGAGRDVMAVPTVLRWHQPLVGASFCPCVTTPQPTPRVLSSTLPILYDLATIPPFARWPDFSHSPIQCWRRQCALFRSLLQARHAGSFLHESFPTHDRHDMNQDVAPEVRSTPDGSGPAQCLHCAIV